MNESKVVLDTGTTESIVEQARRCGLDASLLYETVIAVANEGLLTAGCVNAAAGILLTELGLPEYFFRHISKDALKRVLQAIGTAIYRRDGRYALRSEAADVRFDVDGGVQARIATEKTRDRMEQLLDTVMTGNRVEYYFGKQHRYYTYIVRPEMCKRIEELKPGESPFAFALPESSGSIPELTRQRYESFLQRARRSVVPLVEVSEASRETRVMFLDDFGRSALPVIRRIVTDLELTLTRAYWETCRGPSGRIESVCSMYLEGRPAPAKLQTALRRLHDMLAAPPTDLDELFVQGVLTFEEHVFAVCAGAFVHSFIYKDQSTDRDIMNGLSRPELRDAMAKRIFDSNRAEYTREAIKDTIRRSPELVKWLYRLFDRKFNPRHKAKATERALAKEIEAFQRRAAILFIDDTTGYDIFLFMARLITDVRKTNFYMAQKRSFCFRLDPAALDPLVFSGKVHGIFFVVGFYAIGTHMRAEDVARGGMRLIRVTPGNYETELDNMPLLNYALGCVAQRLKHKDIAESGSKGVIVPGVDHARDGLRAMFDVTEGIMDLMLPSDEVIDYLGTPEMIFFGPDEGTAGFMDAVAERAKERGYRYWRTITTGKGIGIPHDTYGLTVDRRVFGLLPQEAGTELQIDGASRLVTPDTGKIYAEIGRQILTSGMTTMSVLASFRAVLEHLGLKEESVNLMMTGGPDGDLGANQIQSFKGKICLILDGGSVLFDPQGLDKQALMEIAFARHTEPRLNSLAYPEKALSARGFKIPRAAGRCTLPGGEVIEDGAFFHRTFLSNPAVRKHVAEARMQAFVPCGGFKDTLNGRNIREFLQIFAELQVIVEGANVFFDNTAREVIATQTKILQIRDSSANKGGVTSSSIAEVLTGFLLGDDYEKVLVKNARAKSELIREVFDLIYCNAVSETKMLLALHAKTGTPLYKLSIDTSEQLFALQGRFYGRIEELRRRDLVGAVLKSYVPAMLLKRLGMPTVLEILDRPELRAYRDAILTKKLAAMALYQHAADWEAFLADLDRDFLGTAAHVARV